MQRVHCASPLSLSVLVTPSGEGCGFGTGGPASAAGRGSGSQQVPPCPGGNHLQSSPGHHPPSCIPGVTDYCYSVGGGEHVPNICSFASNKVQTERGLLCMFVCNDQFPTASTKGVLVIRPRMRVYLLTLLKLVIRSELLQKSFPLILVCDVSESELLWRLSTAFWLMLCPHPLQT